jgi:hypothetical protein
VRGLEDWATPIVAAPVAIKQTRSAVPTPLRLDRTPLRDGADFCKLLSITGSPQSRFLSAARSLTSDIAFYDSTSLNHGAHFGICIARSVVDRVTNWAVWTDRLGQGELAPVGDGVGAYELSEVGAHQGLSAGGKEHVGPAL